MSPASAGVSFPDMLAGTINIITGDRDELAKTLAEHDEKILARKS